jgi:hypothetical protein
MLEHPVYLLPARVCAQVNRYVEQYAAHAALPTQPLRAVRQLWATAAAAHHAAAADTSTSAALNLEPAVGDAREAAAGAGATQADVGGWSEAQAEAAYAAYLSAVATLARAAFAGQSLALMVAGCCLMLGALAGHFCLLARCVRPGAGDVLWGFGAQPATCQALLSCWQWGLRLEPRRHSGSVVHFASQHSVHSRACPCPRRLASECSAADELAEVRAWGHEPGLCALRGVALQPAVLGPLAVCTGQVGLGKGCCSASA